VQKLRQSRRRIRPLAWVVGLLLAVPLAALSLGMRPAAAANVVNVTFHVPASVQINPCFPADVVNLSGDIHVVITTTADSDGGYHVVNQLNSQLSGASITTGTKYVNNENKSEEWYARPPFPAIHTQTYDFVLISQSNTDNYVLHATMHETVNAQGIPTATVDNYSMGCQG
jgi:hypothetical protein